MGVELISTSGTAAHLTELGLPVTNVEDLTGVAEMLGGRVKTLHPGVHGALLARRDRREDSESLAEHGIKPIDMLVVNLYQFQRLAARRDAGEAEVLEAIDIGGPAMIRAAAKNHDGVAVIVDPDRYGFVLDELRENDGIGTATPPRARGRGLRAHGRLRHRDRELVQRRGELPRAAAARVRQGGRPGLRREPAPARRVLRRAGRAPPPALARDAALGQDGLVQQPARPRLGGRHRARVHAAGVRDRQARQPVRRGARGDDRRGVREGAGGRFDERLRRRRRAQPPGQRRARRARSRSSSSTCCIAPGFADEALDGAARALDRACSRAASGAASPRASATTAASTAGCSCRTTTASPRTADDGRRHHGAAGRAAVGRPPLRVARLQARALQRDRRGPDLATVGIGAGQMSRVDAVRIALDKAEQPVAGGGARVRRLLPLRGRRRGGARTGRHGVHPAGRQQAGRGSRSRASTRRARSWC